MPDLIAQGSAPHFRWRRRLRAGESILLGREVGIWSAYWDAAISRQHCQVCVTEQGVDVVRCERAVNPLFFHGNPTDRASLRVGEHFVLGETTFTLVDEPATITLDAPPPVSQQAFSAQFLQRLRFRDADQRIDVLSRLPELVTGAHNDDELFARLTNLLLTGIPNASTVGLVELPDAAAAQPRVLYWDSRQPTGRFAPSERLMRETVRTGKCLVHIWQATGRTERFTQQEDALWACCTPIRRFGDCDGVIYVTGERLPEWSDASGLHAELLQDDAKFIELVSDFFSRLRHLRQLERRDTSLRHFISPVVIQMLGERDPDAVLTPREADVSVLFCDLRGFSRQSEQSAADLLGLLSRVSSALGMMTNHILEFGGVIGDFHGDAAMGFWGWPLDQADAPARACLAALAIRREFFSAAQEHDHLSGFQVGIGIAHGRAVAGKIGTVDQVKVTVFGPVVNLAARLETLTKQLHTPILVDDATAAALRSSEAAGRWRLRRVARVRPVGLENAVDVSELLPPEAEFPLLQAEHLAAYEVALDAFLAGDWERAFSLLHRVPAEDRVKDFLTIYIAQNNRQPPPHWDGVITLAAK